MPLALSKQRAGRGRCGRLPAARWPYIHPEGLLCVCLSAALRQLGEECTGAHLRAAPTLFFILFLTPEIAQRTPWTHLIRKDPAQPMGIHGRPRDQTPRPKCAKTDLATLGKQTPLSGTLMDQSFRSPLKLCIPGVAQVQRRPSSYFRDISSHSIFLPQGLEAWEQTLHIPMKIESGKVMPFLSTCLF